MVIGLDEFRIKLRKSCIILSFFLVWLTIFGVGYHYDYVFAMENDVVKEWQQLDQYINGEGELFSDKGLELENLILEPCLKFVDCSDKGLKSASDDVDSLLKIFSKLHIGELKSVFNRFANFEFCSDMFAIEISEVKKLKGLQGFEKSNRWNFIVKQNIDKKVIGVFSVRCCELNNLGIKKNVDGNVDSNDELRLRTNDVNSKIDYGNEEKNLLKPKNYVLVCNLFLDSAYSDKCYDYEIFQAIIDKFCLFEDVVIATGLYFDSVGDGSDGSRFGIEKFLQKQQGCFNVYYRKNSHEIFGNYGVFICLNRNKEIFNDFFDMLKSYCYRVNFLSFFDSCFGLGKSGQFFGLSSKDCGAGRYLIAELSKKDYLKEKAEYVLGQKALQVKPKAKNYQK